MSLENNEMHPISPLSRQRVMFRRIKIFGLMAISTLWASFKWAEFMPTDVSPWLHWTLIILFALTFGWIALYFWSAIFGFWELKRTRKYEAIVWPKPDERLTTKTAVLIPSYNENPVAIYGRILAMAEDLSQNGGEGAFDFFVLSDTTKPEIWLEEEALWFETKNRFPQGFNLFYRHRPKNTSRKSGNIEDFCTRWGKAYDFMLELDADSLIGGATMVQMAKLMQKNPTTGIIQAPPQIVNSQSFFSRLHQFAGKVYGQIVTAGLAYWQAWDSNYWGHNAIIRTQAFIESCGLPTFKGKAPFGGQILSHDFVEAALIRRAGWLAWMLPELKQSYEECPPAMLDFAIRDRRWCQGNLQHIRVLLSQKLHPISRVHFVVGIMSYLSSLLWFLLLFLGVGIALWRYFYPPTYFSETKELFPTWPVFNVWGTISLFVISMVMLFFPKILGIISLWDKKQAKYYGGRKGLFISFWVECLFSALCAPIMMLFQSKFIIEILLGLDSGWKTQNRDQETTWRTAFARHWAHTLIGVLVSIAVYNYAHSLFYWMLPITLGLMLSIPLSVISSKVKVGQWFKAHDIFITPEEQKEPLLLRQSKQKIALLKKIMENLSPQTILKNQLYLAAHIYLLPLNGPEPDFATGLIRKVEQKVRACLGGAELELEGEELRYILYHPDLLKEQLLLQTL